MIIDPLKMDINSDGTVISRELKELLKNSEFEEEILNEFNLIDSEVLKIKGLDVLLKEFLNYENNLIKTNEFFKLSETDFLNFDDNGNNIKECFISVNKNDTIKTLKTSYSSKFEYIDQVHLKSLYIACAEDSNYSDKDLFKLRENFFEIYKNNKVLLGEYHSGKYQMLQPKTENTIYLRGIRSREFKDYTNKLALFFSAYFFKLLNKQVQIKRIELTDSSMKLILSEVEATEIKKIGKVYKSYEIRNNEIGKGSFIISKIYLFNFKGKDIFINPNNSHEVKFSSVNCTHRLNLNTILNKIKLGLQNSEKYETELKTLVTELYTKKISEQFLTNLTNKIYQSKTLRSHETEHQQIKGVLEDLNTSLSLLEALGKLNDINIEYNLKEYVIYLFYSIMKK